MQTYFFSKIQRNWQNGKLFNNIPWFIKRTPHSKPVTVANALSREFSNKETSTKNYVLARKHFFFCGNIYGESNGFLLLNSGKTHTHGTGLSFSALVPLTDKHSPRSYAVVFLAHVAGMYNEHPTEKYLCFVGWLRAHNLTHASPTTHLCPVRSHNTLHQTHACLLSDKLPYVWGSGERTLTYSLLSPTCQRWCPFRLLLTVESWVPIDSFSKRSFE